MGYVKDVGNSDEGNWTLSKWLFMTGMVFLGLNIIIGIIAVIMCCYNKGNKNVNTQIETTEEE